MGQRLNIHVKGQAAMKAGPCADAIYEAAQARFSEQELIDLTIGVITINNYNRINIAFPAEAGNYQPGQYA